MRDLTQDISRIKKIEEASLFDTCTVDSYSETTGDYNDLTKSWISGTPIKCGVNISGGNKNFSDEETKTIKTVTIRLPQGTTISTQDKITVTKRFGISVTSIQYAVISIKSGVGVLVVECQGVEV